MLDTQYQEFIAISRYARWDESKGRRETWDETVDRYLNFMVGHVKKKHDYVLPADLHAELRDAILHLEVLPSMRAMMTAGPALEKHNVAGYNCSYVPIDHIRAFDEIVYILMCGTGVGFSVEQKYVQQLPIINEHFEDSNTCIVVDDSKMGWAKAYRELLSLLWNGQIPKWDMSKIRPAGARLMTFGGRASGPGPLEELFIFTVNTLTKAAGRRLTSLEVHDLVCKIGEVVVVGGVRRSALISLTDLSDMRMATAKSGQWWEQNPQRRLANNSVAYTSKPDMAAFMSEWKNLYDSKSGERGIFNRQAARKQVARNGRRDANFDFGTNPCSEIILRPNQFCNLSTVVVNATDTEETLARKVRLATVLGTLQSTLTDFKYLRKTWKNNTEEERLLGVSMTGQLGNSLMSGQLGWDRLQTTLENLKQVAIDTNKDFSGIIGIPQSTAVTCVKPEGTVSQLVNAAAGMHPWFADFYVRNVRADNKDPLTQFMIEAGIPHEPDVMSPDSTTVFSFPIAAPDDALTNEKLTAIDHLEIWLAYQRYWCEHKPSITVNIREHEWMAVGAWVFDHFDEVSGISFLPFDDHTYLQAPYTKSDKEEFLALSEQMPKIDWTLLSAYEKEDNTTGTQTLNCTAGACEVVDIVTEIQPATAFAQPLPLRD